MGVQLTAQGQLLVGHADVLLERLELADADLAASLTDVSGTRTPRCFQAVGLELH